jgi:hypothetical protein
VTESHMASDSAGAGSRQPLEEPRGRWVGGWACKCLTHSCTSTSGFRHLTGTGPVLLTVCQGTKTACGCVAVAGLDLAEVELLVDLLR